MATSKVGILTLLFLCVILLLGSNVEHAEAKFCVQSCDPRVAFMTCPFSKPKYKKSFPECINCCGASKGCKLFRQDGSIICTGT
ncbi:hypothetical protein P3L10_018425 [Capsicum annuum]